MRELEIVHYLMLATITEAIAEYLFSGVKILQNMIKYLSAVVGISIAFIFQANIFELFGLHTNYELFAFVLTGLLISRGSNVLNDLIEMFYNLRSKTKS